MEVQSLSPISNNKGANTKAKQNKRGSVLDAPHKQFDKEPHSETARGDMAAGEETQRVLRGGREGERVEGI